MSTSMTNKRPSASSPKHLSSTSESPNENKRNDGGGVGHHAASPVDHGSARDSYSWSSSHPFWRLNSTLPSMVNFLSILRKVWGLLWQIGTICTWTISHSGACSPMSPLANVRTHFNRRIGMGIKLGRKLMLKMKRWREIWIRRNHRHFGRWTLSS